MVTADPTIQRQVLGTARRLLADDAEVSISRIADQAGVSRATLYRHFGSRRALLEAVEMDAPMPTGERILEAAADLMTRGGLHAFSMDELASAAGVSRATVYRLFPTKAALFGEIVRHFAPFEPVLRTMEVNHDRPPSELLPLLARTFVTVGSPRLAVLRSVLLEASSLTPDAIAGVQPFLPDAIGALATYLARHMETGEIRRMHPILAVQVLMGPVFIHLLTRPMAERLIGLDMPIDQAIDALTAAMLEGLAA